MPGMIGRLFWVGEPPSLLADTLGRRQPTKIVKVEHETFEIMRCAHVESNRIVSCESDRLQNTLGSF